MKPIIDLHQDLILYVTRPELYKDRQQTSFEKIKSNNLKVTVVSGFPVPGDENYRDPVTRSLIEQDLETYNQHVADHPEFVIIRSKKDLMRVLETEGLFGLILHIEGLNAFEENDWALLEAWYDMGLRSIGPVWNLSNAFGGGTIEQGGLTNLGKKLIAWCEEKQVILDFAHMNEEMFWDSANIVARPVFVSHGNARTICDDLRNYTDDQIRTIGTSGGVMGLFFSKKFITTEPNPTIDHVLRHVDHIKSLAGIDTIAIGSDFGGIISGFAEGLDSVGGLRNLESALLTKGYSNKDIEKIFFRNAERVLKQMLPE